MIERPILFSSPMVRAILAARKTQTRRVVKPQPMSQPVFDRELNAWLDWEENKRGSCMDGDRFIKSPYGVPGDRLWVRETWAMLSGDNRVWYRADPGVEDCIAKSLVGWPGWNPSIFMPRENSRLTLEVVNVRVERLQEISESDALAEGCRSQIKHSAAFADLWDSINGKKAPWSDNPWVWVITFKRAS